MIRIPRPRKLLWKEIRYGRKYRDISFPKPQSTKKRVRRNRKNNASGGQGGPTPPAAGGNEKVVHEQTAPEGLEGKDDVHVDRGDAGGYDLDKPETLMAVWRSEEATRGAGTLQE